jgi:hypothetical protein
MNEPLRILVLLACGLLLACGASQKLSEAEAKEKIRELGLIDFKDKQIQVQRIIQSGEGQAVAEANLQLAFRLSRSKNSDWQVDAVRLSDRDWVEMKAFLAALDEVRARQTRESLLRLQEGIQKYRQHKGVMPDGSTIVRLTDALFPTYLKEVIRYDGWNQELTVRASGTNAYQIISAGPDGIPGNGDDISLGPLM